MVQQPHWVAVNKPKSVLTTVRDDNNRKTVVKLIPAADELRLVPVGGMDRSDTGLLLLTNEVDWIHRLTHPSFPHRDVYEVTASGAPSDKDLTNLPDETDSGTTTGTYKVELLDVDRRQGMCKLRVSMDHRRPRQLEELIERLGCTLVSSKRLEFAGIKLRGLKRGQWRELTPGEVATVKASAGKRTPDSRTEVPPTPLVRGTMGEVNPPLKRRRESLSGKAQERYRPGVEMSTPHSWTNERCDQPSQAPHPPSGSLSGVLEKRLPAGARILTPHSSSNERCDWASRAPQHRHGSLSKTALERYRRGRLK
jgi:23S rRNA pseudouridine2605 synthase